MTALSEYDQILEDLCFSNGLNIQELKSSPFKTSENVKYLEMFFVGFPTIMHMDKFPNLTELKIIAQDIVHITGLETCLNLTELWISECKLKKISGLKNCCNLKKLFLYTNQITKIENLEQLNLEILWLNDNEISQIEGFSHMTKLVELNLSQNRITTIGQSLNRLENLEILNLAANQIEKFQEIIFLQNVPNLKHLCFKDPQYGFNPVTMLCNYSLYVIYHLPDLVTLDTLPISQKIIKELADSTINKKKLWYFMRLNTVNRQMSEMIEKIDSIKLRQSLPLIEQINSYNCKIKDAKKQIYIASFNKENKTELLKRIEDSTRLLEEKIVEIQKKLSALDTQYQQYLTYICQEIENKKVYINMELENGGNIRFEFGTNETWYKSCCDLLMARFCTSDYILRSIIGIKVKKVMRVTNRILLAKYEENILYEIDENDYINNRPSLRKKIDYLMYCWRPKMGSQLDELHEIIKTGFKSPSEYKKQGYEEAIPFTNSLSVCDQYRIESMKVGGGTKQTYKYALQQKTIRIIIALKETSNSIQQTSHLRKVLKKRVCECKSKQSEWFLFNKNLAVPEYVIEFEYQNKFNNENTYDKELAITESHLKFNDIKNITKIEYEAKDKEPNNETIINKEIRFQALDLDDLEGLTEINFHNCELTSLNVDSFKNLRSLKKLTLSFNKLKTLKEINNIPNLEYLDVSYNQLESLGSIKSVTRITYLDLSNNQLADIMPLNVIMKQYFPMLSYLDLTNNLFKKISKMRMITIFNLKNLTCFNKIKLTDREKSLRETELKLNNEIIKQNCSALEKKPRSLQYSFVTDLLKDECLDKSFLDQFKRNDFHQIEKLSSNESESHQDGSNTSFSSDVLEITKDNQIFEKMTTLYLDNQELFKLTNLESLVNLKWASFNNNYLKKIEGLEKCTKLEELSFENNLITSFSGLDNMENLIKLNLNNNEIIYNDDLYQNKNDPITVRNVDFVNLHRLSYLSISNNKISSIKFITKLPSIIELYASFNQLKNLRDIYHLKSLNVLAVLDLWCNPMCKDAKYRLFVIYHLKNIKALDGNSIEPSEYSEAKETFGGKLTCDFIAEKFTHSKLCDIRTLEFPQCGIKVVDLGLSQSVVTEQFESLRSLNLENNNLTSFSGLIYLKNLRILCLNNNKIESIYPKAKQVNPIAHGSNPNHLNGGYTLDQIMPNLEVLHLAYNGINDLIGLQIGRLISLKALFLQGNEIVRIEGLETLRDLRELVLDKNKIKVIGEQSFVGQSQRLLELHIEENRLRDLINIQMLRNLQKLYCANNKINEFADIDKLLELNHLQEISFINNPISRRPHYRITMVYRLKRVKVLDMSEINDEDKIKAEIYFSEQAQLQQQPQMYYNGIIQTAPQIIANQGAGVSINQLDHQFLSLSQSPRLRSLNSLNIVDKQLITNPQTLTSGSNHSKKLKNPYEKMNKDFQTRYRNQYQ